MIEETTLTLEECLELLEAFVEEQSRSYYIRLDPLYQSTLPYQYIASIAPAGYKNTKVLLTGYGYNRLQALQQLVAKKRALEYERRDWHISRAAEEGDDDE